MERDPALDAITPVDFDLIADEIIRNNELDAEDNDTFALSARELSFDQRFDKMRQYRDLMLSFKDSGQPTESVESVIATLERFSKLILTTKQLTALAEEKEKIELRISSGAVELWVLDWGFSDSGITHYVDLTIGGRGAARGLLKQHAIIVGEPISVKSHKKWITGLIIGTPKYLHSDYDGSKR